MAQRNAAESLVAMAVSRGVRICFANPGTTELPLVAALDTVPGMRAVLCLFEGVCSAAADGYARMSGEPAMTLLHLGPGFANAIANLHNARRAHSPVFNVIGDHATWHVGSDPPLASDVSSLARPVSDWLRAAGDSSRLATDTHEAIAAANTGRVATLIVPHDVALGPAAQPDDPFESRPPAALPSSSQVAGAAQQLKAGGGGALFLGASGLSERGLCAAQRIASVTGCRLICDTFPARLERGGALPAVERLPYFPEQALESLAGLRAMVIAGTRPPVSFFGYPGVPSEMTDPATRSIQLTAATDDVCGALEQLAEALDAPASIPVRDGVGSSGIAPPIGSELTPQNVASVIADLQPEGAIVMDEGLTAGLAYFDTARAAPRHTYLALTGGAIGQGLPCATGAALACPQRAVIALQADGSGLYTLQSLWTQAREGLDVTNVILANGGYKILEAEIARTGERPGPQATALTTFDPLPDWAKLAQGFGVPGVRVDDVENLQREFAHAIREPGPHLIEVRM